MTSLIYLFAFVLVLSLVVIIHEGGHFFVARLCGVQVTEFSMGFGHELWGKNDKHGTRWKICAIPLGGYVKMLGDEDPASAKQSTEHIAPEDLHKTFLAKPLWQRALIIFAGPGMNYVMAFVLLVGLFWGLGMLIIPPTVGSVMPDSAAEAAGIQVDDTIVSINDRKIESFQQIKRIVQLSEYGEPLTIVVNRAGQDLTLTVQPIWESKKEPALLGVQASTKELVIKDSLSFVQSVQHAGETIIQSTVDTLKYLGQIIFKGRVPRDLRGPLGIAEASGDALMGGWIVLLGFIAQISIAIGLMNLLPIPVLDGGHLALYAVEAVRRKPLSAKVQSTCIWIGFGLLMIIFAYSLFLDVPRIFQRIVE